MSTTSLLCVKGVKRSSPVDDFDLEVELVNFFEEVVRRVSAARSGPVASLNAFSVIFRRKTCSRFMSGRLVWEYLLSVSDLRRFVELGVLSSVWRGYVCNWLLLCPRYAEIEECFLESLLPSWCFFAETGSLYTNRGVEELYGVMEMEHRNLSKRIPLSDFERYYVYRKCTFAYEEQELGFVNSGGVCLLFELLGARLELRPLDSAVGGVVGVCCVLSLDGVCVVNRVSSWNVQRVKRVKRVLKE